MFRGSSCYSLTLPSLTHSSYTCGSWSTCHCLTSSYRPVLTDLRTTTEKNNFLCYSNSHRSIREEEGGKETCSQGSSTCSSLTPVLWLVQLWEADEPEQFSLFPPLWLIWPRPIHFCLEMRRLKSIQSNSKTVASTMKAPLSHYKAFTHSHTLVKSQSSHTCTWGHLG